MINRENLLKLARFVNGLPWDYTQFSMKSCCCYPDKKIIKPEESAEKLSSDPSVSACLLGHGPLSGIVANKDESWDAYALRVFGVGFLSDEWCLFFGRRWPDDTKTAAKRVFDYYPAEGVYP